MSDPNPERVHALIAEAAATLSAAFGLDDAAGRELSELELAEAGMLAGLENLDSRVRALELDRIRSNGNASRDELARRVRALELALGLEASGHSRHAG